MLGETLKCIRIANENMKLHETARGIAVSSSYISEIENGKKNPSLKNLKKLSLFYNIPLRIIMELDEYNDTCSDLAFQRTLLKVLEYYLANSKLKKDNSKDEKQMRLAKTIK